MFTSCAMIIVGGLYIQPCSIESLKDYTYNYGPFGVYSQDRCSIRTKSGDNLKIVLPCAEVVKAAN